jgi:hypothetical protein
MPPKRGWQHVSRVKDIVIWRVNDFVHLFGREILTSYYSMRRNTDKPATIESAQLLHGSVGLDGHEFGSVPCPSTTLAGK